jgi:hypothetical protein
LKADPMHDCNDDASENVDTDDRNENPTIIMMMETKMVKRNNYMHYREYYNDANGHYGKK